MNPLKRLGIALWRTFLDQGDLIATHVLLPPIAGAISARVRMIVAKFEAMEITDAGAVRAGVFQGLHHQKGSELALQVIGEHQLV
jgi:hypothetical protein